MADNDTLKCYYCDERLDPCDRLNVMGYEIGWHDRCNNVHGLWAQSASRHRQYCHIKDCDKGPAYPFAIRADIRLRAEAP